MHNGSSQVPYRLETAVPAVVVQLTRNGLAHGALGICRSLGRRGIPVTLATNVRHSAQAMTRYARTLPWTADPRVDSDAALVAHLLTAAENFGVRPVLYATDDVTALICAEYRQELLPAYRLAPVPHCGARTLADKMQLSALAAAAGVPTPATYAIVDRGHAQTVAASLGHPFVVKAADPALLVRSGAGRSVSVMHDAHAWQAFLSSVEEDRWTNILLQEYVPGGADSLRMFCGYLDAQGTKLFAGVATKLGQQPPRGGETTLCVIENESVVHELADSVLSRAGYAGPVDMDFRWDARNGTHRLLDVNVRLGANARAFAASDGWDAACTMYADLTGQPPRDSSPAPSRTWVVENSDLASRCSESRASRAESGRTLRGWFSAVRQSDERAWASVDDPLPALAMAARTIAGLRRGH